jgi:hypothetical protein
MNAIIAWSCLIDCQWVFRCLCVSLSVAKLLLTRSERTVTKILHYTWFDSNNSQWSFLHATILLSTAWSSKQANTLNSHCRLNKKRQGVFVWFLVWFLLYAHRHRSILGAAGHIILTPANHLMEEYNTEPPEQSCLLRWIEKIASLCFGPSGDQTPYLLIRSRTLIDCATGPDLTKDSETLTFTHKAADANCTLVPRVDNKMLAKCDFPSCVGSLFACRHRAIFFARTDRDLWPLYTAEWYWRHPEYWRSEKNEKGEAKYIHEIIQNTYTKFTCVLPDTQVANVILLFSFNWSRLYWLHHNDQQISIISHGQTISR